MHHFGAFRPLLGLGVGVTVELTGFGAFRPLLGLDVGVTVELTGIHLNSTCSPNR